MLDESFLERRPPFRLEAEALEVEMSEAEALKVAALDAEALEVAKSIEMSGTSNSSASNAHSILSSPSIFCDTTNVAYIEKLKELIEENLELFSDDAEESSEYPQFEEIIEYLETLLERPLNINSASKSELKKLSLLTPFQVISLLDYREKSGAILSFSELALIQGFSPELVEALRPFIKIGNLDPEKSDSNHKKISQTILAKYFAKYDSSFNIATGDKSDKYIFTNDYFNLRYNLSYLSKVDATLILKKDYGEPIVGKSKIPYSDFISAGFSISDIKLWHWNIERLVIGDFSARFGQGLTLWNSSFSITGDGVNGYMKSGESISLYRSNDEYNFFRGLGFVVSGKKSSVSAMLSYRSLDATLNNDGSYKSIKTDGKHTSLSAIGAQNNLNEFVCAVSAERYYDIFKIAFSYSGNIYDRYNGTPIRYYNKYKQYNGYHNVASSDWYLVLNNLRLFGESALSFLGNRNVGSAHLMGGMFTYNDWSLSFLTHLYSKDFVSTHSGAYSNISDVANQLGVAIKSEGAVYKRIMLNLGVEYTQFRAPRFNINAPSSLFNFSAKVSWKSLAFFTTPDNEFWLKFSYKRVAKFFKVPEYEQIWRIKYMARIKLCSFVSLVSRGEYNSYKSYACGVFLNTKNLSTSFDFNLGYSYYDASVWNGRIYMIEKELPKTYASNLLYGKSHDFYSMVSYRASKKISAHLKFGQRKNMFYSKMLIQIKL